MPKPPSVEELLKRAEAGEAEAQFLLSRHYISTKDKTPDHRKWLLAAAEQGHVEACLATVSQLPDDDEHFAALKVKYTKMAMEQGSAEGEYWYAQCLKELSYIRNGLYAELSGAVKYEVAEHLKSAAKRGHLRAVATLVYEYGSGGVVPRRPERAFDLARQFTDYVRNNLDKLSEFEAHMQRTLPDIMHYPLGLIAGTGGPADPAAAFDVLRDLHLKGFYYPARFLLTGRHPFEGGEWVFAPKGVPLKNYRIDYADFDKIRTARMPVPDAPETFATHKLDEFARKHEHSSEYSRYLTAMKTGLKYP